MIHPRHATLLHACIMSLVMSFLMSLVLMLFYIGVHPKYFGLLWMRGFVICWALSFPLVLVLGPLVGRAVDWLTRQG